MRGDRVRLGKRARPLHNCKRIALVLFLSASLCLKHKNIPDYWLLAHLATGLKLIEYTAAMFTFTAFSNCFSSLFHIGNRSVAWYRFAQNVISLL